MIYLKKNRCSSYMLLLCSMLGLNLFMQAHKKVVVIGAGLAGLTTAYRLDRQGYDVEVYEARNRVGGRIFTVMTNGFYAELGGQNILDGGDAENIFRLLKEFELEVEYGNHILQRNYFDGQSFTSLDALIQDMNWSPESLEQRLNTIAQHSTNMQDVFNALFSFDSIVYKAGNIQMMAYEGGALDKLSPWYAKTLYYMLLGGLSSAHKDNEEHTIAQAIIKNGNAALPQVLAQALAGRLHLNKPLVAVSKNKNAYNLQFSDGAIVTTDILVLAIPCSVYKDINFAHDVLPQDKLAAFATVGYGTNAKIAVPFLIAPTSDRSYINDLGCVFFNRTKNVVNLYLVDKAGCFSADTMLDVYTKGYDLLIAGFGEALLSKKLPEQAKDAQYVSYKGPVGHSWGCDLYAKGSYSYITAGQEECILTLQNFNGEKVKSLFVPIGETLFFAGEHTTILTDVLGTMEAACESGERTARMIVKVLGITHN